MRGKRRAVLSGSQVTRNYKNNIEKTKSQYIKFSHDSKSLWFKTGIV